MRGSTVLALSSSSLPFYKCIIILGPLNPVGAKVNNAMCTYRGRTEANTAPGAY